VTPTAQTTYTLVGEALGCTATAATTINVNALPTVNAVATSTAAICAGASQTLTAAGSATNFTWTPSEITSGNAVVNPTVTTTYTLTGDDGICSNTANVTVTVTPLPTLNVDCI
jgi:L,D-peptidoglycan transpeptidase YkuD (ErfK/YbiS/YcfS/YnhG family)